MKINKLSPLLSVNSFSQQDPYDMTSRFNTQLDPIEELSFQQWAADQKRLNDLYDYDLRGFYKAKGQFKGGHGSDRYKKPNHPTFSVESQYHGKDYQGGAWTTQSDGKLMFTPSQHNLKNMPEKSLRKYFGEFEPDVMLNIMKGR